MPKFYAVLQSQTDTHQRSTTLSTVPCHRCGDDPTKRPACKACDGRGEEDATKESAVAYLEGLEREYVNFRLDDPATLLRYATLPQDALDIITETTVWYPEDSHLIDGRFVRRGKVTPARGNPDYNKMHKGWRAFHEQEKPYKVKRIGIVGPDGPTNAVTGGQYGTPMKNLLGGTRVWDWDTDTIKCALTTNAGYTVDIDTHDVFTSVTELTGTGYTAGGATLTASAPTYDTATDQVRLDAADTTWATSTITARRAVVYKSTGTASTSPLISFLDFGADVTTTAGTFQITWDATGIWILDIT